MKDEYFVLEDEMKIVEIPAMQRIDSQFILLEEKGDRNIEQQIVKREFFLQALMQRKNDSQYVSKILVFANSAYVISWTKGEPLLIFYYYDDTKHSNARFELEVDDETIMKLLI